MNLVPQAMRTIWVNGDYTGPKRPITRILISKHVLRGGFGSGVRSLLFTQITDEQTILATAKSFELPNLSLVEIDRRLGSDAASIRVVMKNQRPLAVDTNLDVPYEAEFEPGGAQIGDPPTRRELRDLGTPGYYSYRRGIAVDSDGINPWGHKDTAWKDILIPNRMLRTFQGYGTDGAGSPADDTGLVLTGTWLIDRVEFKASGEVIIEGRDLAKLLIEQKIYPPIIPTRHYPLEFCADRTERVTRTVTEQRTIPPVTSGPSVARHPSSGWDSSNFPYYGYNGSVFGHRPSDAFDADEPTFWLSVAHAEPSAPSSFAWIGADTRGELVHHVRIKQRWRGLFPHRYKLYISVKEDGQWQGSQVIPYTPQGTSIGAAIPYVLEMHTAETAWNHIDLPRVYQADEVRLTFTDLHDSGPQFGEGDLYRVGIYEFEVIPFVPAREVDVEVEREVDQLIPGNIKDYTSIVKILAAYSGFFWPSRMPGSNVGAASADPALARWDPAIEGRVWGDFFNSGAYPVDPPCIPSSYFDQKSAMDGINLIKEILGFIFQVDATGGIHWRPPNIWRTGNYVKGQGYKGETSIININETKVLIDYGTTIDDENLRSDIVVVSADDPSVHGTFQPGWAEGETEPGTEVTDLSLLGGQKRVMLVANYPFGTAENPNAQLELQKFAFLTSLWIHWSYRKSRFRVPGFPAFEPDDQVRIYERVTSESYIHYIEGYTSVMDMEAGTWFMDMDTHWLGNGPSQQWMIRSQDMHPALFAYLKSIGQIPSEVGEAAYPDDWFLYTPPTPPTTDVRVEDDYSHLFPLPPSLSWPSGDISTEIPETHVYTTPPSSGGGGGGGGGGTATGGSTINCSNQAMFAYWGSNCSGAPQSRILFAAPAGSGNTKSFSGQTDFIYCTVHTNSVPAWEALIKIIVSEQYRLKAGQCGAYNCRHIRNSSSWSNHSWGTATDLNWSDLPQGRQAPSGHPVWRVAQRALSLRTTNGSPIFRWGGNWGGASVDPMHFEVCCKPTDLSGGVVGSGGGSGGTGGGGAIPV